MTAPTPINQVLVLLLNVPLENFLMAILWSGSERINVESIASRLTRNSQLFEEVMELAIDLNCCLQGELSEKLSSLVKEY